jgi:hypothetical protein
MSSEKSFHPDMGVQGEGPSLFEPRLDVKWHECSTTAVLCVWLSAAEPKLAAPAASTTALECRSDGSRGR